MSMSSAQQNGTQNFSSIPNNNAEFFTQNFTGRTDFSSLQTAAFSGVTQNGKSEKCTSEVYLVKEYGSNSFPKTTADDFTTNNFNFCTPQNSMSTNNSVQIQIINGQPSVQANLQQLQTPNGPITVAILPDFNALRPYFVQVQRPPGPQQQIETVQRYPQPIQIKPNLTPATNGKCQQNQKFLPIQPKINGGSSNPLKSASPVLIQKNPTILPQPSFPVVRTQGNIIAQTCSPQPTTSSMTIQLTGEDQQQISILTEQLKKILSSNSPLSSENERIVEILQQKRSAILEKTFLQQQRSFMLDQTASSSNEQNSTTVASMSTSIPFAATTQSNNVPAQIVQINGLPYLAVAANSRTINPTTPFVCNDVNRSQDMQRVFTPASTLGLQLPIRPHLISGQSERTAGPSVNTNQNLNCPVNLESKEGNKNDQHNLLTDKKLDSKIVDNVRRKLLDDQKSSTTPDCKTQFKNSADAVSRLLSYHVYNEPNLRQEFLDQVDASFKNKMNSLSRKKNDLFRQFQSILLKESTFICPTSEYCLINELISNTEKDLLNQERKMACKSPDHFVRKLIKLKDKKQNEKTPDIFHSEGAADELVTRLQPIKTETVDDDDTKEKFDEIMKKRNSPVSPSTDSKSLHYLYRDLKKIKRKVKLLNNGHKNSSSTSWHDTEGRRSPLANGDDGNGKIYVPEERLKISNEIPKLLLKINTVKRKCVVEESSPDAKRVPPLKIKLTKAPQTPQPLTRLSSLGLESSDEDESTAATADPQAGYLSSSSEPKPTIAVDVVKIYNDFVGDQITPLDDIVGTLNWPFVGDGENGYKSNITSNKCKRNDWDNETAQFIRSKLKVNECLSSPPDGDTKTNIFL